MCGIGGIVVNPLFELDDARECAQRMSDSMAHRGPDDAGMFAARQDHVVLVNRRLAIRDLSPLGQLPMVSADRNVALTYNGEIYNADELRTELERAGYTFRSTSDTEVILRGYEAWGENSIRRLRGMFALAIYDARGCVLLARDPLGVKPLYYAETEAGLLFASELKAMHTSGLVSRAIEPRSVVAYLRLGSIPTPRTIYHNIHALEPGCLLTCDLASMETRTTRYWSLPTMERVAPADVVEQTRAALLDAVRAQLVSDVPLGVFLSGGLDSSAVAVLMRQATNGALRTCSMIFEQAEYSEANYARAVAEKVGADHFERVVTEQDALQEMPRIVWAMDQPTIDGVNSYFVSQTARQAGLTVALSGLGGDELFGGYPTFYAAPRLLQQMHRVQQMPAGVLFARTVLSLAPHAARYRKVQDALQQRASPTAAYLAYRGLFSPSEVRALVSNQVWESADDLTEYVETRAAPYTDSFAWTSRAELSTYTLNQLLRDTDAMSMAHSLEVRVPLLDPRFVEYVLTLPASAKENGNGNGEHSSKVLLHKALGDLLPSIVRERSAKQGFTFPFEYWLRGDLKMYFEKFAPDAGGWLKPHGVARVMSAYDRKEMHWSRAWSLLVLQAWMGENQV
ncbi:MAG TPA: asparagine synthase (glutamine-hydrolyzing) [Anaerolineae bacterium]|nr:asparagine synthase (glutamine-hydrolyzing) [Anaerolineae bacterium]